MRATSAIAAHRLRAGWRGWAALALLTGLAGGAVLAATAGARRTDSAFPRFLRDTNSAQVLVGPALSGVGDGFDLAVGRLPGVMRIAPVVGLNAQPLTRAGRVDQAAEVAAPLDGRLGKVLERPRMLAGRQPRPDRPDEVMVDQIAAAQLGLHVGSPLRLAALGNSTGSKIRYLTEHVVGMLDGPVHCVVAEVACRYFSSLAFPDRVTVGIRVAHIGRSSVRYEIGVFRNDDDAAAAEGHFVHVFVERGSQKPVPIPDEARALLGGIAVGGVDG